MRSALQISQKLKATGKPTFLYGSGQGAKVTIFGATGFLGRYVVSKLGRLRARCNVANRGDEMDVRHMKPMFALGDSWFPFYNIRDDESIKKAIGHSDIVINLDGTKSRINYGFEEVNVEWPAKLTQMSQDLGVRQLIHVSALAASADSKSEWSRTKAQGEIEVHRNFPDATIVRPGKMFGDEDRLLNWIANMPSKLGGVPLVNGGTSLLQPVWVQDVAEAIISCIDNEWQAYGLNVEGKTLELVGPEEYSWRELRDFVNDITETESRVYDLPPQFAEFAGGIYERLPVFNKFGPHFCKEDALQQQEDVVGGVAAAKALAAGTEPPLTLDYFDIKPTRIEEVAFSYLHRYREGGHFAKVRGYHGSS